VLIPAEQGYRLWAPRYDDDPNPLLALEMRLLGARLGPLDGLRMIDVGTGTGRWMEYARTHGMDAFGLDLSRPMLLQAAAKSACLGRVVQASGDKLPFANGAAALALCSFVVGYSMELAPLLCELARVARRVIISDLHPSAIRAGWTRSFRSGAETYELEHRAWSTDELMREAHKAGLAPEWSIHACFGEPERKVFSRAGREHRFEEVKRIPAVLITSWSRH
jgi:ubiquinone/menaquinone biosynthesis C-methylase UbiE